MGDYIGAGIILAIIVAVTVYALILRNREARHAADWHDTCDSDDGCLLTICYDPATSPHGDTVEPGCLHHRTLCLEHLWECDVCRTEAQADARW
jgi:hypothetical protein